MYVSDRLEFPGDGGRRLELVAGEEAFKSRLYSQSDRIGRQLMGAVCGLDSLWILVHRPST